MQNHLPSHLVTPPLRTATRARSGNAIHPAMSLLGAALIVSGCLAVGPAAAAPATGAGSWLTGQGLVIGGAVGSTDYGTGFKANVGSGGTGMQLTPVPGLWRWELQLQSFGSETFVQFGNSFKRNAWSFGGSLMPQLPLMPGVAAYAKLGVHYLSSHASGPGLSTSTSGIKPGIGAGLRWQAHPRIGVRLEYENIGSSGGDVVSLGVEMPF
ncbi:MAG: outer membrane beta-barrel protein [Burkholderiales bacterium]|nr:outer membrane beta-barrel protein [Burkholderiales bacterium]